MNMEKEGKKDLVVTSTFSGDAVTGGACNVSVVLNMLRLSQEELAELGFRTSLCFTVNGEGEQIKEVVEIFLPEFPGEKMLTVNKESKLRGPCFIGGVRNALEMIGSDLQEAIIITADLCGKAPHDPSLFAAFLQMLEGNPDRVIVGSIRYDNFPMTIDDCEMRSMGFYQWAKFGADGEPFNIQSPALIVGPARLFKEALRMHEIYEENYPKYISEPWPGPGVPGLLLCLLSFAGARLHGATLPIFGEWRPSRPWEVLLPNMIGTIVHGEVAEQMKKDGLFD